MLLSNAEDKSTLFDSSIQMVLEYKLWKFLKSDNLCFIS